MRQPDKFFAKLFEARCISRLNAAGLNITALDPDYGTGRRPDFEVEVSGQPITVECTSLRYDDPTQRMVEQSREDYEAFTWQLRSIIRPYLLTFNALPNLADEQVVDRLVDFLNDWFAHHTDGDTDAFAILPPFPGLERMTHGQPVLRISYYAGLPYVVAGGTSPTGIPNGSQQSLMNALRSKAHQVTHGAGRLNVIAVDVGQRIDLIMSQVAPAVFLGTQPPNVQQFWAAGNHAHVHTVVLCQDNIHSNDPIHCDAYNQPALAAANSSVVASVVAALGG